ncbi:metallophosphoesterase [Aeoliella sp. ICT_H6.2]|uniref:Metallophosphoesterase n=1 Tax=Aeoliella straminimaris TaxID=2954799 RepID=A0A9X2JGK0_9BACT|nr:metallophosphoesterase [Aeoliella straminimaris]MCO6043648.1 metallophosphoesterase [Aeoliella straminimaris]
MFDIIGDIHGHAGELVRLLEHLDYTKDGSGYRHPKRTVLFVGDFIDHGPHITEVLRIVRAMVDSGAAQAVMGNHEFNAIAYHTPDGAGSYLRPHSEKNNKQHSETMKQLSEAELQDALEWFRMLPMWLDLDSVRLVHACWSANDIVTISARRDGTSPLTEAFVKDATDHSSALFHAVDRVLKGTEMELPAGMSYRDKDGHERTAIRTRWFDSPNGQDIAEYALPNVTEPTGVAARVDALPIDTYPTDAPPVFFGHYWLTGEPTPQTRNAACVDYSVARGGKLVAYRWNGERGLSTSGFVTAAG